MEKKDLAINAASILRKFDRISKNLEESRKWIPIIEQLMQKDKLSGKIVELTGNEKQIINSLGTLFTSLTNCIKDANNGIKLAQKLLEESQKK